MEVAIRHKAKGGIDNLTPDDLLQEYEGYAADGYAILWDLSDHMVNPRVLTNLFTKIAESQVELKATMAIDLDANRLESAHVKDFKVVLQVLKKKKPYLRVRFGFEVFMPYLKQAMEEEDMLDVFGEQVVVNSPWTDQSLRAFALEQCRANNLVEKRLAKQEAKKGHSEQLKQMKGYRDTDDRLIEEGVACAVAELLEDGQVIFGTRYPYQSAVGDLDGLVVGRRDGRDVVVLVEAKHNMDTMAKKAQSELFASVKHWEWLKGLSADELESDETVLADYQALHLAEYGERAVFLAFGGSKFSESVVKKQFNNLQMPWIYVVANSMGKFKAQTPPQVG
ncbi:hypothetical protein VOLCADRAFT_88581 [Volvox carteri f. nagariensis]|uniref:Uncharacterized protein n=1 Tax=Volvox carteri f. nagariensis TaxID=3068 RepID=D8TPD8_VOLCA|nr:uncharacterized protein VOLCADRAFT_88581 [Volvox carteri f. nagariensis]EFJ50746.1 hypothetical protein VOLCADRAFT_88581 [Volvox carteri f. nagariensis]|eukprot:XP_002948339.1 hypothetical protein VOLCADRAFT_88581 [Volvox carteri f. nagariensis]